MDQELVKKLNNYFQNREDVSFAYLFGSVVSGNTHSESDVDIGIYFVPKTNELEYESIMEYENEDKIWLDLEKIIGKRTDMVVLNRAPSTLAYSVLQNGKKIFVKDEDLLSRFYLSISLLAEDFRDFVSDYIKIEERSNSLNEIDRNRLGKMVNFLEKEMKEFDKFRKIDQPIYISDSDVRRSMERWVENIVNSSIDMAKIILASEKKQIPETYRLIIENLGTVKDFDQSVATSLSAFSKMRNLLAHEYLDIRFVQIKKFTKESEEFYKYLIDFIKKFIALV
ncbi:MAG: HepT-like ribonuclease domain-containing protein [bacterium]